MSLSSERFLRLASSGDYNIAMEGFNNYMTSHCLHPIRLKIHDSHTMKERFIKVPCGSCYHCRETKINEWVTRMYAHCEDYKHVYFITLTYTSFYKQDSPITKLLLTKLSGAIWHYDNKNSTRRGCWRPCLLVKKHYQNFFKRLRKNTHNDSLTYVACGEYGKQYGAPHFHAILFSKVPISHDDIKKAWSISLWQNSAGDWSFRTNQNKNGKPFNILIGRTDFNDLVQNGTFNTTAKIKVDNNYMNASHCFSYVCKYVCKQDYFNKSRVTLAYYSLWKQDTFVRLYDNELQFYAAQNYLKQHGIDYQISINKLKQISYEKKIPYESSAICRHGLSRFRTYSLYGKKVCEQIYPDDFAEFREKFAPFVEFSRSTPIGSVYAKNHLQEFKEGIFKRPLLQEKGFVVPRYFTRKADEFVYGLRKVHKTIKSNSLRLGDLPLMRADFEQEDHGNVLLRYRTFDFKGSCTIAQVLEKSSCHFIDKSTGEHIILPHPQVQSVPHYIFDKHKRMYVISRCLPIHVFVRYWLDRLQNEMKRYRQKCAFSAATAKAEDAALCIMNDYCDVSAAVSNFEELQMLYLTRKQKDYDAVHTSCE